MQSKHTRYIRWIRLGNNDCDNKLLTLCSAHSIPLQIVTIEDVTLAYYDKSYQILLIDYQDHYSVRKALAPIRLHEGLFEVILYNVPRRLDTDEHLSFGRLKGLFYSHTSTEHITAGLIEIINGSHCLPTESYQQLVSYLQCNLDIYFRKTYPQLSQREIEILQLLKEGFSNTRIADDLFIAESTVKSHLYALYKKLNVKKRIEAIEWGKQNLLS